VLASLLINVYQQENKQVNAPNTCIPVRLVAHFKEVPVPIHFRPVKETYIISVHLLKRFGCI